MKFINHPDVRRVRVEILLIMKRTAVVDADVTVLDNSRYAVYEYNFKLAEEEKAAKRKSL